MSCPRTARGPILADRVRRIGDQSFAFLPHRFLRGGFLQSLSADELRLYLFLVLAADRHGVSFYSHQSICSMLHLNVQSYLEVRDALRRKNLIAEDGSRVQVLSLPPAPVTSNGPPMPRNEQLAACQNLIALLARRDSK